MDYIKIRLKDAASAFRSQESRSSRLIRLGFAFLIVASMGVMVPLSKMPIAHADNVLDIWQAGTSFTDEALAVAVDSSGVYVVGRTSGDFDGHVGGFDAFIRKYDTAGNIVWTDQFGSTLDDFARGVAIDSTGVYVVGTFGLIENTFTSSNAFVRKYDTGGNLIWEDIINAVSMVSGYSITTGPSGVYIVGDTWSDLTGSGLNGPNDGFIRQYDSDGNVLITDQFGGSSNGHATDVAADSSGVYVVGYDINLDTDRSYLMKYSADLLTVQVIEVFHDNSFPQVAVDSSGVHFYAENFSADEAFVVKYSHDLIAQWSRLFPSEHASGNVLRERDMAVDSTGVYVVGLTTGALEGTNSGFEDAFVRKYFHDGNLAWTEQIGSTQFDSARGIALDPSGVFVVGITNGNLGGQTAGGHDYFVALLDAGAPASDTTAPVIEAPADITLECNEVGGYSGSVDLGTPTVTDEDPNPTVTHSPDPIPGFIAIPGITVTWTATDESGNSGSDNQTINVVDTTAPVLTVPPEIEVTLGDSTDPTATGFATATDVCDDSVEVSYTDGPLAADNTFVRTWTASDGTNEVTGTQKIVLVIPVDIDIKPGGSINSINLKKDTTITVAVLGSSTFDIKQAVINTIKFGDLGSDAGASPKGNKGSYSDVNKDGFLDLILKFGTPQTGIDPGDVQACLKGKILSGALFKGCDAVRTV